MNYRVNTINKHVSEGFMQVPCTFQRLNQDSNLYQLYSYLLKCQRICNDNNRIACHLVLNIDDSIINMNCNYEFRSTFLYLHLDNTSILTTK